MGHVSDRHLCDGATNSDHGQSANGHSRSTRKAWALSELRQKQPRVREPKYLAWLRTKGCCCGCRSAPRSDAAHIRAGSHVNNKRPTGMQEKPDDRWALPLNRSCHMRQHAFGSEIGWWHAHGIDPFQKAMRYYAVYFTEALIKDTGKPADAPNGRKSRKVKPAKKRTTGHGWPKKSRKIASRGFSKRNRP